MQSSFFEGFFALIPDMAVLISPEGFLKKVNPACERITGFSEAESLERPITDFVHPDDAGAVLGKIPESLAGGPITAFVVRCVCKDGSYKWIEWEAAAAPDRTMAFATGRDITDRKRAQEALEDKDRQLSTIFSSVSDALFLLAVEGLDRYRFVTVNRRFLQLTGLTESQVLGKYVHEVVPQPSLDMVLTKYRESIDGKKSVQWEEVSEYPAGLKCGEVNISPIFDESGRCANIVGAVRDLAERNESLREKAKLEEQLRQAQKLESIGRLAGGIAHDFNNFLTVIQGYSELIQKSLDEQDPVRAWADHVCEAARRASRLTSQLLAFSRKQAIRSTPVELNAIIRETRSLLQSLVGEDISIVTRLDPNSGEVMADADQVHQVLMNLAANARDAMPEGGVLTIETARVAIDRKYIRTHPYASPGLCLMLSVSDTGVGMDEETRKSIFEPFFTTKEKGRGTGLGLATVYGIVHQFSGWIEVDSEPGHGSKFHIYLPCLDQAGLERNSGSIDAAEDAAMTATAHCGSETILLVEDDASVRQLTSAILTSRGYTVLTASGGAEALECAASFSGRIDLLITDVVMPGINGRELADRLKLLRPEAKVLFMSGYTADVIVNRGVIDFAASFLAKPFNHEVLSAKVREILGGRRKRKASS